MLLLALTIAHCPLSIVRGHPDHGGFAPPVGFYVDNTGGDNGNDGMSPETAWETIAFANSQVSPGKTVFVRGGTYAEAINPGTTGSSVAPIRYEAYQGETVDINGVIGLQLVNKDYIEVVGFQFSNSPGRWTTWSNSTHILLEDCVFKDPVRSGAFYAFFDMFNVRSSVFSYCSWDSGWLVGDGVTNIEHDLVGLNGLSTGNLFYRCQFKHVPHAVISGYKVSEQDAVDYNVLWECVSNNKWRHGLSPGSGYGDHGNWLMHGCFSYDVGIDGENNPSTANQGRLTPGIYTRGDGNIIRYSTVTRCGGGIFGRASDPNTWIYHNTVYDTRDYGSNQFFGTPLFYEHEYNAADDYVDLLADELTVLNNVFWKGEGPQQAVVYSFWLVSGWLGNDFRFNTFGDPTDASAIRIDESGSTAGFTGTLAQVEAVSDDWSDNSTADPLMVDPDAGDFRPSANSPLIDAATHLTLTNGSGSGSATMVVDNAYPFFAKATWGITSSLIPTDTIYVEDMGKVEIAAVDRATNTLTLVSPQTWGDDKRVWYLPYGLDWVGDGLDIGAWERGLDLPTSGLGGAFGF